MSEVGTLLNIQPDSTVFSDRLIKNFTNSVGSTLVQTAINGGNLEDNLKVALLSGLAGALQGELASQIGTSLDKVDPSVLEYTIHKIAHAAAGCATAAIVDKSNCEAGAIGAGVGEIVAGLMIPEGKTALDLTDDERKSIINTSKIIVGTTAAYAGYDVITAANSADIAIENNSLAKLATTAGKAAYKVAHEISKMPAAARAKLKPSEIAEMLRKEGVQGIIDIGDNINTLISPASSPVDRAFALIDLAIGIDLKAGKNVDVLKADRKIIGKNFNQAPRFQGASSNTLNRLDNVLSTSASSTSGKSSVLNYVQDSSRSRISDFNLLTVGGKLMHNSDNFKMSILEDGTRVILRPSSHGPKTIEIQKANGNKVIEIRYEK